MENTISYFVLRSETYENQNYSQIIMKFIELLISMCDNFMQKGKGKKKEGKVKLFL